MGVIPSPEPNGGQGQYTGTDQWGRPLTVTNYAPGVQDRTAWYNVWRYYQPGNDGGDHTPMFQRAIAAAAAAGGGTIYAPAGTYNITAPISITSPNIRILGDGRVSTTLQPSSTFSGAAVLTFTQANYCAVEHLRIACANGPSSSCPAASAIQVIASRNFIANVLEFLNLNGYCIEVLGSATLSPFASYGAMISKIRCSSVAGGIHTRGFSQGSWGVQAWMTDINLEGVDGPLDAMLIEDSFDVLIENINGAVGQGSNTNSYLHVVGNSASVYVTNPDIGFFPGPASAPVVLIESNANGSPKGIKLVGGVVQGGTICYQATAGNDLHCIGVTFARGASIGASIDTAASYVLFDGCLFNNNGAVAGGSGRYDLQVTFATARVLVKGCFFRTGLGTGSGQVNQVCNIVASNHVWFLGNDLESAGSNLANAFNGSILPVVLRDNLNVNPVGSVTVSMGASPYTIPSKPYPTSYFVSGGTVTGITLDGVATGLTSGAFHVPPTKTLVITYSAAPTVTGYGE